MSISNKVVARKLILVEKSPEPLEGSEAPSYQGTMNTMVCLDLATWDNICLNYFDPCIDDHTGLPLYRGPFVAGRGGVARCQQRVVEVVEDDGCPF